MPKELGTKITESRELGDAVVITRTIGNDEVTVPKLREYHDNLSCSSGGVITSDFRAEHNLGVDPTIYNATLLSHASAGFVRVSVGLVNQSLMTIRLQATVSGYLAVSGLPVHAFAMA